MSVKVQYEVLTYSINIMGAYDAYASLVGKGLNSMEAMTTQFSTMTLIYIALVCIRNYTCPCGTVQSKRQPVEYSQ